MALVGFDRRPACRIEMAVEARQDDLPVGQRRDPREQVGGRRNAAGRAGGDHRMVRRGLGPAPLQPLQQQVAPRRRVHRCVLFQHRGPSLGDDLQKIERLLPMDRQFFRRQLRQAVEGEPLGLRLIEQSRQCLGEQHRLFGRGVTLPLEDQPGQHELPLQLGNRGRRLEQRIVLGRQVFAGGERKIVLVDIADRAHPRQQQGRAAAQPQEGLAQGAAGAARRQQDQDRRQAFGRIAEAVEQAARQRRDEIPVGRDGKDIRSGHAACRRRIACPGHRAVSRRRTGRPGPAARRLRPAGYGRRAG